MEIKKIACVGVGTIGAGWAVNFAMKGYPVKMYHPKPDRLEPARSKVENGLNILVEAGIYTREAAAEIAGRITYVSDLKEAIGDVQLIQESLPEKYDVKQDILAQIDALRGDDVIFASSTSGLSISKIAELSKYPTRCIGAHPYNPTHLIPLVEMIAPKGGEENLKILRAFYEGIGKEVVTMNFEIVGYPANRLQAALGREVTELVMRGVCSVEDVDKAVTFGPGLRWAIMGPSLTQQLGGGEGGIRHQTNHLANSYNTWLKDMACWTERDPAWADIAQAGVDEEMSHRPAEIGNTNASLIAYRDRMLLEILKLHHKL